MLSENGDVVQIDTTGRQPTWPWVSKMVNRRFPVASLLMIVEAWTGENDTKTISVAQISLKTEQNSSVFIRERISVDGS